MYLLKIYLAGLIYRYHIKASMINEITILWRYEIERYSDVTIVSSEFVDNWINPLSTLFFIEETQKVYFSDISCDYALQHTFSSVFKACLFTLCAFWFVDSMIFSLPFSFVLFLGLTQGYEEKRISFGTKRHLITFSSLIEMQEFTKSYNQFVYTDFIHEFYYLPEEVHLGIVVFFLESTAGSSKHDQTSCRNFLLNIIKWIFKDSIKTPKSNCFKSLYKSYLGVPY